MPKIKSIQFKPAMLYIALKENERINELVNFLEGGDYLDFFEIEYEKSKVLKRPDGSVIEGLEEGTKIIQIWQDDNIFKVNLTGKGEIAINPYNADLLKTELYNGLIFLPEDKDLAEKKAKMLTKQLEIQYEIDRLNAEQGWVADWKNQNQSKSYISYDNLYSDGWVSGRITYVIQTDNQYMPETTAEIILAKYSQEELKQYLGKII